MVNYWTCKLKVNGQLREVEIVAENPTFEKCESRVRRELKAKDKDKIEFVVFALKVDKLGL